MYFLLGERGSYCCDCRREGELSSRRRHLSVWALNSKHMQLIQKYKIQSTIYKNDKNIIKKLQNVLAEATSVCLGFEFKTHAIDTKIGQVRSNPLKNIHSNSFKTTVQEQVALNKRQQPKTWILNKHFHFLSCSISRPIYSFQQLIL